MSIHVANNCSVRRFDREDLRHVQNGLYLMKTFAVETSFAAVICYVKAHQRNSDRRPLGSYIPNHSRHFNFRLPQTVLSNWGWGGGVVGEWGWGHSPLLTVGNVLELHRLMERLCPITLCCNACHEHGVLKWLSLTWLSLHLRNK